MTRTGMSPKPRRASRRAIVEIHPDDAARVGVRDDGFARGDPLWVRRAQARLNEGQQPGTLFAPIHWSEANSRPRASAIW
jgi:assimilatory nitrate reductase catalytic subunit